MKDITKKNAEKIAHNIHKKLDNLISVYKYQGEMAYRVERNTVSKWICFKIIPEKGSIITASAMDCVRDLAKKYMRNYNGIFYTIGVQTEYKQDKAVIKPTFEIIIEIK